MNPLESSILMRLLHDRESGGLRPLEHYLGLFPSQPGLVRGLYREATDVGPAAMEEDPVAVPTERFGPYRVIEVLGRGAQGVVFLAEDLRMPGRRVALKVLAGLARIGEAGRRRLEREASTLACLEDSHILRFLDIGAKGAELYVVTRYVAGASLSTLIDQALKSKMSGPLSIVKSEGGASPGASVAERSREVARRFARLAASLHRVHAAGVRHRDIKPGNILVDAEGELVLADFGVCQVPEDGSTEGPPTVGVVGTPGYIAPEVLAAGTARIEPTSEVWALGICLFEALTLCHPLASASREALRDPATSRIADPRRHIPELPRDLAAIVIKATQAEPRYRYREAQELAAELDRFAEGLPVSARPLGRATRAWRWCRRNKKDAGVLGILMVVFVLGALGISWFTVNRERLDSARRHEAQRITEDLLAQGFLALGEGVAARARARFEEALLRQPEEPAAIVGAVLVALGLSEYPRALDLLDNRPGLELRHPYCAWLRHDALSGLSRHGEAKLLEGQLAQATPASGLEWFLQGERLLRAGDATGRDAAASAVEAFRTALSWRDGQRAIVYFELARAAVYAGNDRMRRAIADSLVAEWGDSPVALHRAALALHGIDDDRALDLLHRARLTRPSDPILLSNLGAAYCNRGDTVRARSFWEASLVLEPDLVSSRLHLAGLDSSQGKAEAAEVRLRDLVRSHPESVAARLRLATHVANHGDRGEALSVLDGIIAIDPTRVEAHVARARVLLDLRRDAEAEAAVGEGLRLAPNGDGALRARAVALVHLTRFEEAVDVLRGLVRAHPQEATLRVQLGYPLAELGMIAEAREAYEAALELDSGCAEALLRLGTILVRSGERERGRDCLVRAVESDPGQSSWHCEVATGLLEAGFAEESIAHARIAAERLPGASKPRFVLGNILRRIGNYSDAISSFREALERDPDMVEARINLVNCLVESGEIDLAARELELSRGREPSPRVAAIANNLWARIHVARGEPSKAVAVLAPCLGENDADAAAMTTLVEALAGLGRRREALWVARRAASAAPDIAMSRYLLGRELVVDGNVSEGLSELQAAARLVPRGSSPLLDDALVSAEKRFEAERRVFEKLREVGAPPGSESRASARWFAFGISCLRGRELPTARSAFMTAAAAGLDAGEHDMTAVVKAIDFLIGGSVVDRGERDTRREVSEIAITWLDQIVTALEADATLDRVRSRFVDDQLKAIRRSDAVREILVPGKWFLLLQSDLGRRGAGLDERMKRLAEKVRTDVGR